MRTLLLVGVLQLGLTPCLDAWRLPARGGLAARRALAPQQLQQTATARAQLLRRASVSEDAADVAVLEEEEEGTLSDNWEVDVYSRPVVREGKKLWEVLVCDATGSFRRAVELPSNMVNSREVRNAVEKIMDEAPERPRTIRFFRKAMLNMLSIALNGIEDVEVIPSRNTFALRAWLDQREKEVYPNMEGYNAAAASGAGEEFVLEFPEKLPDALRGEQYAFVTLPLSEFLEGNVNDENVGAGRLCPIPGVNGMPGEALSPDTMIPGWLVLTPRADSLARWMASLELAFLKADLKKQNVCLEVGLSTQYQVARIQDAQTLEAQSFEDGKRNTQGLHFIAVQSAPEDEDVAGFFLLQQPL